MFEGDTSLGLPEVTEVRIAFPGDRAFESYETALANVRSAQLPPTTELPLQQAMLDLSLIPI